MGCNDDFGDTRHSRLELDLPPGTYVVFVDGYGSQSGSYTLIANVPIMAGPVSLAAARGGASVELGAAVAMFFPDSHWTSGVGASFELRARIPLGFVALSVGGRATVAWMSCSAMGTTDCGVVAPSSHVDATAWAAGVPLGFGWTLLPTLRMEALVSPTLNWLLLPNETLSPWGVTAALNLEVRLFGVMGLTAEMGYRWVDTARTRDGLPVSLSGMYASLGIRF
jgi:hypothetical protein